MKRKPTYKQLAKAFRDAMEHLDYTGWGDAWERECIEDSGTRKRLQDTLAALIKGGAA
jgi:hypothetical protein